MGARSSTVPGHAGVAVPGLAQTLASATASASASALASALALARALALASALALALMLMLAPVSARAAPPDGLEVLRGEAPQAARGGEGDAGFAIAQGARRFEFPADHGPHPDFRHEWWYFTGRLRATDGEEFGFELTFFRLGVAPPRAPDATGGSRWRARQVYAAHFAITDIARGRFHARARYARGALGLGESRAAPLAVRVQDWSLLELPGEPGAATAPARWRLQADDGDYAIDLTALVNGPPVLNGAGGLSIKADRPGAASWYYSLPRLPLTGTLRRDGRALQVSGEAWLDREWGSGGLGPRQQGWDWYALQLSDGSALMFYGLRDAAGAADAHSAGTFVDRDGGVHALHLNDVDVTVSGYWDSPRGGRYPAGWRLAVPSQQLTLDLAPVLAGQELPTRPRYWEGAVNARGTHAGQAVSAQGYVELVGYARDRSVQ